MCSIGRIGYLNGQSILVPRPPLGSGNETIVRATLQLDLVQFPATAGKSDA